MKISKVNTIGIALAIGFSSALANASPVTLKVIDQSEGKVFLEVSGGVDKEGDEVPFRSVKKIPYASECTILHGEKNYKTSFFDEGVTGTLTFEEKNNDGYVIQVAYQRTILLGKNTFRSGECNIEGLESRSFTFFHRYTLKPNEPVTIGEYKNKCSEIHEVTVEVLEK